MRKTPILFPKSNTLLNTTRVSTSSHPLRTCMRRTRRTEISRPRRIRESTLPQRRGRAVQYTPRLARCAPSSHGASSYINSSLASPECGLGVLRSDDRVSAERAALRKASRATRLFVDLGVILTWVGGFVVKEPE